jgi:hypothetical protein
VRLTVIMVTLSPHAPRRAGQHDDRLNWRGESSEDQEIFQKLRQSGDFEKPAQNIVRTLRSAFVKNAHDYSYPPQGPAATRVFLAATVKTLGLSLEV